MPGTPRKSHAGATWTPLGARRYVRALLDVIRVNRAQHARFIDDALIVTSELISNADRHAGGLTGFRAHIDGDSLCLSASDTSSTAPRTMPSEPARPGGFGWLMIQRLCSRVLIYPTAQGKTITAVLELP